MRQPTHSAVRAVPMRDTPEVYGTVTRVLHWTIALLVVWQLLGMGLTEVLGDVPVANALSAPHTKVGTILWMLIVSRVIWALTNRNNRPPHGQHFLGQAANLGHGLMYVIMLAVPTLGLLRAYGSNRPFAPFGFEIFPAQNPPIEWMVKLAGMFHGELAWVLAVLIVGHVVMAALHEGMWRDGTLARMVGRRR